MECGQLSENHLSLPRTTNPSYVLAGRLLLQDELFSCYWQLHRFIKTVTTNHAVHFMVHSIYQTSCHQDSQLKNYDSELQLINASLVQLLVSFRGWDEKLQERNKRLGHTQFEAIWYLHTETYTYKHTYCGQNRFFGNQAAGMYPNLVCSLRIKQLHL